jgi:hypothetical protein
MTIKVTQSTSSYSVKVKPLQPFKISVSGEAGSVAGSLTDLDDVDVSGVGDKFVIMYNASTGKYTAVNPDEVLSAASNTETTQPGLPNDFINTLDVDLDNKIDLDAGTF